MVNEKELQKKPEPGSPWQGGSHNKRGKKCSGFTEAVLGRKREKARERDFTVLLFVFITFLVD